MPTAKNWFNYIFVNLGFIAYIVGMYYISSIQEIKSNWATYRCNPIYMPLASNFEQNFTYCIQNITTGLMGNMLQPLTFITNSLSTNMSSFMTDINAIRGMFSKIRGFISNIFQTIFGVFLNIIIEFQKIIIGIRDLFGKTIGILTTLLYVINGSILTMQSAWNGPAGKMVRTLSKCFHPQTKLALKNGKVIFMNDACVGDVLENGSIVHDILKIDNYDNEELYVLKGRGVNKEDIYVTGSHVIFNQTTNKYMYVKNYGLSEKQNTIQSKLFSCLITSDHILPIGNEVFWDWEDDEIIKTIV